MVGKIFRQSEGIGTDPGPQIANGYLFGLETMVNTNIQRETVRRLIEIQDGVSIYRRSEGFQQSKSDWKVKGRDLRTPTSHEECRRRRVRSSLP